MALFEDKKKSVDIYKKGSATEVAQSNMNAAVGKAVDIVTAPAQKAAEIGVLTPAKKLMTDVIAPGALAVAAPVLAGRESQNRFMSGQALNANRTPVGEREALAATMGPNYERKVGGVGVDVKADPLPQAAAVTEASQHGKVTNISPLSPQTEQPMIQLPKPPDSGVGVAQADQPQPLSVVPQKRIPPVGSIGAEGSRMTINLSPNDEAIKGSLAAIDQRLASGAVPTADEAARIETVRQQAGFLRGGTDRVPVGPDGRPLPSPQRSGSLRQVGNMDVSFDRSVSPGQRAAFLENPVRPTAQINRFDSLAAAGGGMTQGQRASLNAGRILASSPNGGSTSGPGKPPPASNPTARRDYYKSIDRGLKERGLANQERDLANNEAATALAGGKLAADIENNTAKNQVDQMKTGAYIKAADANTANDSLRSGSLSDLNRGKLAQIDRINKLQEEFINPATDPKRKGVLATQLKTLANKDTDQDKQDKLNKPHYVPPQFDNKGKQRPGTGTWVTPNGGMDINLSPEFDPDNPSKEDRLKLEYMKEMGMEDELSTIASRYGIEY